MSGYESAVVDIGYYEGQTKSAAAAPGPRPLSADETVELVKSLRWRLLKNFWKVEWKERKWLWVLIVLIMMMPMVLLVLTTMQEAEHDRGNGAGNDDRGIHIESDFELYFLGTMMAVVVYFALFLCGFHSLTDLGKITSYLNKDIGFLYASLIRRTALVGYNFRRALAKGAFFGTALFLVSIAICGSYPDILPPRYLPVIAAYCFFNFLLGALVLLVNNHSQNHRRRVTAHAGGNLSDSIPWTRERRIGHVAIISYPFMIAAIVVWPWMGIAVLLAAGMAVKFWRETVLPGCTGYWHEDVFGGFLKGWNYPLPNERPDYGGYAGLPPDDVRELPHKRKWYERWILDKGHYRMRENAVGFGVLAELGSVLRNRATLRLHLVSLAILAAIGPILIYTIDDELAFILLGVAAAQVAVIGYVMGENSPVAAGRFSLETMYQLPFPGKKIVLTSFFRASWAVLLAVGLITAFLISTDEEGMSVIDARVMVSLLMLSLCLMSMAAFWKFTDMRMKQTFDPAIFEGTRILSVFLIRLFYGVGVLLVQVLVLILPGPVYSISSAPGLVIIVSDALLLSVVTHLFLKKAIKLYDTISITR